MKFLTLTLLIFLFSVQSKAQDLSLKIDSIKIYHLPLSLKTTLALTDDDIRNWTENIASIPLLKIDVVSDTNELNSFENLNVFGIASTTQIQHTLDPRIVVDVFLTHGLILTISMDVNGYHFLGNEKFQRARNTKLIAWLNSYIPALK